jgi:hypothetical protein
MHRQAGQQVGQTRGNLHDQLCGPFHRHIIVDHKSLCPAAAEEPRRDVNICILIIIIFITFTAEI